MVASAGSTKQVSFDPAHLVRMAAELAERLWEARVLDPDGELNWPTSPNNRNENRGPSHLGWSLYNGRLGVALFFAALAQAAGSPKAAARSRQILAPLAGRLDRFPGSAATGETGTLGGLYGLGSLLYGLTAVADFLAEPELAQRALVLAGRVPPERLADDSHRDVLFGSAGLILACLAAHRRAAALALDPSFLADLARQAGESFLRRRAREQAELPGSVTWSQATPNTGFSHGAAGIALALWQLGALSGDAELREAALEVIDWEDAWYDESEQNWPDLRQEVPAFRVSWCHGAPGIALGRQGMLDGGAGDRVGRFLEPALDTTRDKGHLGIDHLCCGNLGRADILHTAALRLGKAELLYASRQVLYQVLDRAERLGRFLWQPAALGPCLDATLFNGAAGAGYTLLRFAMPSTFPSVLLLG